MSQTAYAEHLQDLLRQAQDHHRQGELAEARQIYEAMLQIDSENQAALEGLKRTQLTNDAWAEHAPTAHAESELNVALDQVRERLASGQLDEARRLIEEITARRGEHSEVRQLRAQVHQVIARQTEIAAALDQARSALASRQHATAIGYCQRVLSLDPGHREAEQLLEQAELASTNSSPATTTAPLLELDLSMATLAPTPAPPRTAAPTDDTPSVKDLLEAAGDIGVENEVTAWEGAPASEPSESEGAPANNEVPPQAMHLLNNAQQLFDRQNYNEAIQLAGRALALHDGVPGAQQLIDRARAIIDQRGREAEQLLQSAIELIDRGQPEPAVPMLKQVLELVPGHREATDYLAKASKAIDDSALNLMMKAAAENKPMFEQDLLALERRTPGQPASVTTNPTRHEVAASEAPSIPLAAAPPPLPPPVPPLASGRAVGASSPTAAKPDAKPTPARPESRPAAIAAPRASKTGSGIVGAISEWIGGVAHSVLGRVISAVLALAILTVTGWITGGIDSLLGSSADVEFSSQDEESIAAARAERAARRAAAAAAPAPAANAANAEPAGSLAASPANAAGSADPAALREQARTATKNGDLTQAVKLLEQARAIDPSNFDLADELQQAKQRLVTHQADLARFQEAQDAWKLGDYEEAMRLLYRLPDELKPPHYNRWLADGWYNLGVLALQRGDAAEAAQFFYDGLELNHDDKEMLRHREVAKRYKGRPTDSTYSTYVNGLALREFRK